MIEFKINGKSILKEFALSVLGLIAYVGEYVLRFIYLCLPLGLFMFMMSLRKKCNSITAIDVYANEKAVFQQVYPGALLVLIEPKAFLDRCKVLSMKAETFIEVHKYSIFACLLFIIIIVLCHLL